MLNVLNVISDPNATFSLTFKYADYIPHFPTINQEFQTVIKIDVLDRSNVGRDTFKYVSANVYLPLQVSSMTAKASCSSAKDPMYVLIQYLHGLY